MIELLSNYIKMLKSGYFYKSFLYVLILTIPSIVKALSTVRSNFYEILFVIIVGFSVIFFNLEEIGEKNYIFCLTLPIRISDIIKISYLHTYVIYILGFIGTVFVSIISHQKLPTLYLLFIVFFLLCTNILYPALASCELKLSINSESDAWAWVPILFIGMILFSLYYLNVIRIDETNTIVICEILSIVITSFIAVLTVKKSYNLTLKKVMGL